MEDEIRYVSKVGRDAWLMVQMDNGTKQSLPSFLKVRITRAEASREYFEILEGALKGQKASVSRPAGRRGVIPDARYVS